MQLHISTTELVIQLDWQERLWACHISETVTIPMAAIRQISTDKPEMEWYALRAPGTAVPGGFTAGTYYAKRGREFWYVTGRNDFFVIDIEGEYYKRIVLTLPDNIRYAEQLKQLKARS